MAVVWVEFGGVEVSTGFYIAMACLALVALALLPFHRLLGKALNKAIGGDSK